MIFICMTKCISGTCVFLFIFPIVNVVNVHEIINVSY